MEGRASITLQRVNYEGLNDLIGPVYRDDADLPKYHYSGGQSTHWQDMAACTLERLAAMAEALPLEHYAVRNYGQDMGYVSILRHDEARHHLPTLVSFAIHPAHRNSLVLSAWLLALSALFGEETWVTVLREKNTRAISFFERNGFVKIQHDPDNQQYTLCRQLS